MRKSWWQIISKECCCAFYLENSPSLKLGYPSIRLGGLPGLREVYPMCDTTWDRWDILFINYNENNIYGRHKLSILLSRVLTGLPLAIDHGPQFLLSLLLDLKLSGWFLSLMTLLLSISELFPSLMNLSFFLLRVSYTSDTCLEIPREIRSWFLKAIS